VSERAGFDFVLSELSLDEVGAKRDPRYMQWAVDVLDQLQIRVWVFALRPSSRRTSLPRR
jgi:hypothetical protein